MSEQPKDDDRSASQEIRMDRNIEKAAMLGNQEKEMVKAPSEVKDVVDHQVYRIF